MKTIIHSNGSKWYGEKPDSINKLIQVLETETIEEHFFQKFSVKAEHGKLNWFNHCPIREENGITYFFGNFERVSHVFNIETTSKHLIQRLSEAIKANAGWKLYYQKNLL